MKDRIRQLMESQHMTQQVFAAFIGIAPATLSGIFNDRTKPTINIVEAIKQRIPAINTDWLMFGSGPMYASRGDSAAAAAGNAGSSASPGGSGLGQPQETLFDLDTTVSTTPQAPVRPSGVAGMGRNVRSDIELEIMKNIDKAPRRVTEIRVFYDDQTWESFVPAKK